MTTYLSVTESMEMIEKILEIQTDGNVQQFVKEVYAVMEKTLPKKNCIYVISAPSSGKNYVFDAIRTFYLNTGQMGNFNRNTSFPFQDCDSRRVILWNEPNIEPSAYETVKMLLGGDTLSVNKKYEDYVEIYRTPIIMLTNNEVLNRDPVWRDSLFEIGGSPVDISFGASKF